MDIKQIAGVHLGKAGDGTLVKPYQTPDKHDKSLLVPIPRSICRDKANINPNSFVGYDVWHAYEMSFLNSNGMPVTGVLKLCYPASSEAMIESKSLKLYLNSFDLERFDSVHDVIDIITADLVNATGCFVTAYMHLAEDEHDMDEVFRIKFDNIDKKAYNIQVYQEDASLLDVEVHAKDSIRTLHTANLRSNCEITNQKDTGNCYIVMRGNMLPTLESLTKYIISMREAQHFHENVTEIIYNNLMTKYNCTDLLVASFYNRRGGIDINPVRASSMNTLNEFMNDYHNSKRLFKRTLQQ